MEDNKVEFEVDGVKYGLVFNLNVMKVIQRKYETIQKWGDLVDAKGGEVNLDALILGLTEAMNENIDIENETAEIKKPFLTEKQVGRIITKFGLNKITEKLNQAVVESTKSDEKNA